MSLDSFSQNTSASFDEIAVNSLGVVALVPALIVAVVGVGIIAFAVWKDAVWVRRLRSLVEGVGALTLYALYGVGALAPFALVGGIVWLFLRLPGGSQVSVLKWLGVAAVVFLALAGVGWVAERWFQRVKANIDAAKEAEA